MRKNIYFYLLLSLACTAPLAHAVDRVVVADFDERPVSVKAYRPAYPPGLLKARVAGLVNVSIVVDESGTVIERAVAKSTNTEFEQPALDAMRKWKFKPALKAGKPVAARMTLQIAFQPEN